MADHKAEEGLELAAGYVRWQNAPRRCIVAGGGLKCNLVKRNEVHDEREAAKQEAIKPGRAKRGMPVLFIQGG